jgi:hypothetical protein
MLALFLALPPHAAAGPYDDLVKLVPETANVLLLLDVKGAQETPLGIQRKWAEKYRTDSLGGLGNSSPLVTKAVLAAELDPTTLRNNWEIALLDLKYSLSQNDLVKAVGGTSDTIGGQAVVLSPHDAYAAQFSGRMVGRMKPANRQAMGRWLKSTKGVRRITLSPYLRDVADNAPPDAQVVMALDLTDVIDAAGVRRRLKKAECLAGKRADIDQLADLLAGLKGLTLTMRIDRAIHGELRIDFSQRADAIGPVAKPMVLEVMDRIGAAINDLESWQSRVQGRSVVLSGDVSAPAARLLLSLVVRPTATSMIEHPRSGSLTTTQDPKVAASQRYFSSVQTLLKDLKQQKASSISKLTRWYNQFADQIDELPILNVDEELLKYGSAISHTLRELGNLAAATGRTQNLAKAQAREADVLTPYGGGYAYGNGYNAGGYGYYYGTTVQTVNNYGEVYNYVARAGNTMSAVKNQTWKNIDQAGNEMRQKMTQKYQVEFR